MPSERLRVLIVDDDQVVLTVVQHWLEAAHYEVQTHSSAFGTSGLVLKSRPDVVLLDLGMPGLNGEALANLINRDMRGTTAVIFHSGKDLQELERIAEQRGALGAIQKTNDAYGFIKEFNALTAALRQRRASQDRGTSD